METRPILVYVAGPLDHGPTEWQEEAEGMEIPINVAFFLPRSAYRNDNEATIPAIDNASRHVINCADGLLAWLPEGARCFGTIREIEFACRQGKPVAIVSAEAIGSLMTYDVGVYGSSAEALRELLTAIKEDRRLFRPPNAIILGMGHVEPEESDDD